MQFRLKLVQILALPRYYARGLASEVYERQVFLWAQAIGFKVLITIVPLILIGTGLAGNILQQSRPYEIVELLIRDMLPGYHSEEIVSFLSQLQSASGALTLLGIIGLAVTALTLFTTLRIVLSNVFREDWHKQRSLMMGYAFDLRMALQTGLFFAASTLITVARQTLNQNSIAKLQEYGFDYTWLLDGWQGALYTFGLVLPLLLSTAVFFQLIWFTPLPRPPWKSALTGAIFSGILWEIGKIVFTAYATSIIGFDESGLAALGDTFLLIIILVVWAYLSGLILTLGAIVTLLHERKHREPELLKRYLGNDRVVSSVSESIEARELGNE